MMSRPMMLVLLMLVLIITSQFEWKQELAVDVDSNSSSMSQKQRRLSKGIETVKEKIILMQEQNIRRLNELVRHLQEQLQQCRSSNGTKTGTGSQLTQHILDLSDIKF